MKRSLYLLGVIAAAAIRPTGVAAQQPRPRLVVQEALGNRGTFPSFILFANGDAVFIRDDSTRLFADTPGYYRIRLSPERQTALLRSLALDDVYADSTGWHVTYNCRAGRAEGIGVRHAPVTTLVWHRGRTPWVHEYSGGISSPGSPGTGCVPAAVERAYTVLINFDASDAEPIVHQAKWMQDNWWREQ